MQEIVQQPGLRAAYNGVVEADQRNRTTTPGARADVGSHSAQLQHRPFTFCALFIRSYLYVHGE
jgi:hypothetical protein